MNQKVTVALPGRTYDIELERGLLDKVGQRCQALFPKAVRLFVVTDTNVQPLYAQRVEQSMREAGFQVAVSAVPAGEGAKSISHLSSLWEEMLAFGLTRTDAVVALGGGVVGDLAGFAASTVLRGVDYLQIPTTLLAQVDSSVGGKVAIDLKAGKNLAGAFWQPKGVLIDPDCLSTLSDRVFSDGMAEVIKYGCILDKNLFDQLTACGGRDGVMAQIEDIVAQCCQLKAQVVRADERDKGQRMLLNFGHTIGHAFELAGGYKTWSHGQGVAAGMCCALQLGTALGITPPHLLPKVEDILTQYDLPCSIPCPWDVMEEAVGLDKKGSGNEISLIVLKELGQAVAHKMKKEELLALLAPMYRR